MNTVKGYEKLVAVYQSAHDQAAKGKGDERHANGQPFHEQRMQQISGLLRSSDGMAFQAIKKLTEGLQFEDHARREAELLGALNYIAGIVIYYRELRVNGLEPVNIALAEDLGNSQEKDGWTPEAINEAAFKDTYKEYTLQEVVGAAALPSWVRWVIVDSIGHVFGLELRPNDTPKGWVVLGGGCVHINKVVPPIFFKNCIWEI